MKITQKGPSQITKFYRETGASHRGETESTKSSVAHQYFHKINSVKVEAIRTQMTENPQKTKLVRDKGRLPKGIFTQHKLKIVQEEFYNLV